MRNDTASDPPKSRYLFFTLTQSNMLNGVAEKQHANDIILKKEEKGINIYRGERDTEREREETPRMHRIFGLTQC